MILLTNMLPYGAGPPGMSISPGSGRPSWSKRFCSPTYSMYGCERLVVQPAAESSPNFASAYTRWLSLLSW
jgi:hypothetical protein